MNSPDVFCPNSACPARGQVGQGNLRIPDHQEGRYIGQVCHPPFSGRKGTLF